MSENYGQKNRLLTQALSSSLTPKKAEGLWFSGKDVHLDGYEFVECRFDNCKLHVSNADNVNLKRCLISDDSYFVYGNSALAAIKLFNSKHEWYYENAPYYVPARDEQGRITLTNSYWSTLGSLLDGANG